jgi:hypothetical protein
MVTFNKNGFISSTLSADTSPGKTLSSVSGGSSQQPNLVFVNAVPVINPNFIKPPPPGGGGGGGGGGGPTPCTKVYGRGGSTGGPQTPEFHPYFVFSDVQLVHNYDGDHSMEIQMYVEQNDDYSGHCFPREYKYRFDEASVRGPEVKGATGIYYHINDINFPHVLYSVLQHPDKAMPGFPLFNLYYQPGPWRLVLVDNDKKYRLFAINHVNPNPFYKDVHTYDMSNGTWGIVHTGFTAKEYKNGNSDDPILDSGVRNITLSNVLARLNDVGPPGNTQYARLTKQYSEGKFIYRFCLISHYDEPVPIN